MKSLSPPIKLPVFKYKFTYAFMAVFALISPTFGNSMAPNRSKICATILMAQEDVSRDWITTSNLYTLNSVDTFRQYLEKLIKTQSQPAIHSGYAIYSATTNRLAGSLTAQKIIDQMAGIQESESPIKVKSTMALTLVGEKNIDDFLSNIKKAANTRGREEFLAEHIVRFLIPIATTAGATMLITGSESEFYRLLSWLLFANAIRIDNSLNRFIDSDGKFNKALQAMRELSQPNGRGSWVTYSQNAMISEETLKAIGNGVNDKVAKDTALANQVYSDAVSSSFIPALRGTPPAQEWVGVDLLFEHLGQAPELHIIIRQTRSRPI